MNNSIPKLFSLIAISFGLMISGCDSGSTGTQGGDGELSIQFKTETQSGSLSKQTTSSSDNISSDHDTLFISGTNGALRITDIQFIVSEFELEPEEADDDSTQFEEFESGPFLIDLPLGGNGSVMLGSNLVPAGFYEELEFEIKNLDLDDDDEEGQFLALQEEILSLYPEWPKDASMVVTGDFISAEGDTTAFTTFADAEIEIEREFEPALEVTETNRSQVLTIPILPAVWFNSGDNTILNLSEYDWETTNQLLEFELEFEDGIAEIEIEFEDENDDDDDND